MLSSIQFPEHYDKNPTSLFGRQPLRIRGEAIIILRKCARGSIETRQGSFHDTIINGNGRKGNGRKGNTKGKREEKGEKDDSLNDGGI